MSVSCECCVLSGRGLWTSWSLVQRSPTECGVSKSVIVKSRRNEEAQAHIGLSSHRGGGGEIATSNKVAIEYSLLILCN
jgi:hypothetical protein